MADPVFKNKAIMPFMVLVKGRRVDGVEEIWPVASCLHSRGDGYVVVAYERALCALFPTEDAANRAIDTLPPGMITEVVDSAGHEP